MHHVNNKMCKFCCFNTGSGVKFGYDQIQSIHVVFRKHINLKSFFFKFKAKLILETVNTSWTPYKNLT